MNHQWLLGVVFGAALVLFIELIVLACFLDVTPYVKQKRWTKVTTWEDLGVQSKHLLTVPMTKYMVVPRERYERTLVEAGYWPEDKEN